MASAIPGWFNEGMRPSPAYLAHRIEREYDRGPDPHGYGDIATTTIRYSVSALQLPEPPARGRVTTMVGCGECGRQLRCDVYSPRLARRVRWRHKAAGWIMIATVIALWCYLLIGAASFSLTGLPSASWARVLWAVAPPVSIFALGIPAAWLLVEGDVAGVRLHEGWCLGWWAGSKKGWVHSLRIDASTVVTFSSSKPPGGYW
jgi:hypothetical protein